MVVWVTIFMKRLKENSNIIIRLTPSFVLHLISRTNRRSTTFQQRLIHIKLYMVLLLSHVRGNLKGVQSGELVQSLARWTK